MNEKKPQQQPMKGTTPPKPAAKPMSTPPKPAETKQPAKPQSPSGPKKS